MKKLSFCLMCMSAIAMFAPTASAGLVTGGTASISLTTSPTNGAIADRFFTGVDAATLPLLGPGGIIDTVGNPAVAFPRDPNGVDMAILGSSVIQPTGRARQTTNLDFTAAGNNIALFLSSWLPATPGFGPFGPKLTGGEQVGIDGLLRFSDPLLGTAVIGDLALQFDPSSATGSREGLTLTNNTSANAIVWQLDIIDATFNSSASGFSFVADMYTTPGPAAFYGLDSYAGRFSINAVVPEPSSLASLTLVSLLGLRRRCRV